MTLSTVLGELRCERFVQPNRMMLSHTTSQRRIMTASFYSKAAPNTPSGEGLPRAPPSQLWHDSRHCRDAERCRFRPPNTASGGPGRAMSGGSRSSIGACEARLWAASPRAVTTRDLKPARCDVRRNRCIVEDLHRGQNLRHYTVPLGEPVCGHEDNVPWLELERCRQQQRVW